MHDFFAGLDYSGPPFQLFNTVHLITLGIILLVNIALIPFRWYATPRLHHIFRYALAALLVVNETSLYLWRWATGQATLDTMLPLHLCAVMVWLSAVMLITKHYAIYEFLYFMGIGAATQALLTPDIGIYGFPHFRFFEAFISHGAIVLAALYMTIVERYRPSWESILHVVIGINIYMVLVQIVNFSIGSNYMWIARKPDFPSLIDHLGPWPWYILSMEMLGFGICLILYLPFTILDWTRKPRPAE